MILMFCVYVAYSSRPRRGVTAHDMITPELLGSASVARMIQILPTRLEKKLEKVANANNRSAWQTGVWIFIGAGLLFVTTSYLTVESLSGISDWLRIPAAITAIIVLSIGTAMPEIFGGAAVVRGRKSDLTLGNLFAATTANLLLVCGIASLFMPLVFGGERVAEFGNVAGPVMDGGAMNAGGIGGGGDTEAGGQGLNHLELLCAEG